MAVHLIVKLTSFLAAFALPYLLHLTTFSKHMKAPISKLITISLQSGKHLSTWVQYKVSLLRCRLPI